MYRRKKGKKKVKIRANKGLILTLPLLRNPRWRTTSPGPLLWDLLETRICSDCIRNRNDILLFLLTSLLHGRSFNNGLTSISSLILTKAQHRFVLDFHSVVYDVVRASRNVTFSRAKLCRICMKSALIFSQFWLLRT